MPNIALCSWREWARDSVKRDLRVSLKNVMQRSVSCFRLHSAYPGFQRIFFSYREPYQTVCLWISWFLALELSAGLQNTRQCICSDWKTLENQSANLITHFGLEGILSRHFFFVVQFFESLRRRLLSSNCSFIACVADALNLVYRASQTIQMV